MSKCDLYIELNEPERRFSPGDQIEGTVMVKVDQDCRCDGLTIERFWRTHGRGNRAQGSEHKVTLCSAEWRAGQQERYPFSLPAPNGPASYHGTVLNLDWYLQARADIPWAIDPKAERDFLLEVPGPSKGYDPGPTFKTPAELYRTTRKARGFVPLFGLIFGVAGAGFLFMSTSGGDAPLMAILMPAVFMLVGVAIFLGGIWNRFARHKLGKPYVKIEPLIAVPGERLRLELNLEPSADLKLNRATALLHGEEVVVSGSGTNRSTHRQSVFEREIEVPIGSPELRGGERRRMSAQITLPDDAAFTFSARDNDLRWVVKVHLDIDRWPDWGEEFPIAVLPTGAHRGDQADLLG